MESTSPLTNDSLCRGRLICRQYRDGYRFSVDAVLVAAFCRPAERSRIIDLGCGSGIIGLLLATRCPGCSIQGVEIQPELAALARDNVRANGLDGRCTIHQGDVRAIGHVLEAESCDLAVCNPPYRKLGSGRVNPNDQAAIARHEIQADLADMVTAAAWCVRNRGRLVLVYPATRLATLADCLSACRLAFKRLRPVYGYPGEGDARLVLVEAVKNGGEECCFLPPLYIYTHRNGPYSTEVQQMYDLSGPIPA